MMRGLFRPKIRGLLDVSAPTFDEITRKMREAGIPPQFEPGGEILVDRVLLVRIEEPPRHRPIAPKRGTAPGAIS
jgi:hypothetical protein